MFIEEFKMSEVKIVWHWQGQGWYGPVMEGDDVHMYLIRNIGDDLHAAAYSQNLGTPKYYNYKPGTKEYQQEQDQAELARQKRTEERRILTEWAEEYIVNPLKNIGINSYYWSDRSVKIVSNPSKDEVEKIKSLLPEWCELQRLDHSYVVEMDV
jgi:hypothetical protein